MKKWEIDFSVFAPVTFEDYISFEAYKGKAISSFYSKIYLSNKPFGFNATVTALASSKEEAQIAGRVFFESMLNVLSFRVNEPMFIYEKRTNIKTPHFSERLIIKKKDFEHAFKIARYLETNEAAISNALSWYSKANISNNVIDEFLYIYNVLEILGKTYATKNKHTNGDGTKNKIFQVLMDSDIEENNGNMPRWISEMNDIRINIAHGTEPINFERIIEISKKLPLLKNKATELLGKIIKEKLKVEDDF
jgi:hypothetical protein